MKKYILTLLAAVAVLAACDSEEAPTMLYVNRHVIEIDAIATDTAFVVVSDDIWTIDNTESWVRLSPASGKNSARVVVSVDSNNLFEPRTAVLLVNGLVAKDTVRLTQKEEYLRITREASLPAVIPAEGGTGVTLFLMETNGTPETAPNYTISDNNQYNWTVTQSGGLPTPGITFSADIPANTTDQELTVTFTLSAIIGTGTQSRSITFTQAAVTPAP